MRLRLFALLPTVALLAALNVMAAYGRERTVTTTTTDVEGTQAPTATADLVQLGRNLFSAKGCASCHVQVQVGPSLTDLENRAATTKPGLSAEQYVRESIVAPSAYIASGGSGGGSMPTLPVSAAELDALVAYLLTR
ncbi:MAG TPA: c-type cytochrome [Acidimicrobiales bacterium]|nr:c-type cytochrome [Acidimicrobiales bacterium]